MKRTEQPKRNPGKRGALAVPLAAALLTLVALGAQRSDDAPPQSGAAAPASLLDRLPGPNAAPSERWHALFYGDAAAQKQAATALETAPAGAARDAGTAFAEFTAAYVQGHDRAALAAALRLLQLAPQDPATELAVRLTAPEMANRGRAFLDAVPQLRQTLAAGPADPVTAFELGAVLLRAERAPGLALTRDEALRLAGRLPAWQLWGPFGRFSNLDFDRSYGVETGAAASYAEAGGQRTPQPFTADEQGVSFPGDWQPGVVYATSYVHLAAPARVLLRLETQNSFRLTINGTELLRNDRRGVYTGDAADGAALLPAGWSRVVVKLGGDGGRSFDLMLRTATGAPESAAVLPAGAALAGAPQALPAPPTLAAWAAGRLAGDDAVALWADGVRLTESDDGENARVELQRAQRLAPNAAPVAVALSDAFADLPDASDSWATSQIQEVASEIGKRTALAVRLHQRLGQVELSEGKQAEAGSEFAQCEDIGFADCDWSAFHLAVARGWMPEARTALEHALAEDGSNWSGLSDGLDFFSAIGDSAAVAEWRKTLAGDPRAQATLGRFELRHGEPAQAVALLAEAARAAPSSVAVRRDYLNAVLQADPADALTLAHQALADFPAESAIAAAAAQIEMRRAPATQPGVLAALDYNRPNLRQQADYLAQDRFWQPWYHAAADVIRDAPGKQQYPNASSVLVLDQMVDRINPDSSRDAYIHQIYRVLDAQGIEQQGNVSIQAGSDLLTLRTIKADGSMLLPERPANLSSVSMPGLAPGDFIETEYIMHTPASEAVPDTLDNNTSFIFSSSQYPYHYSDYIVLAPDNYKLSIYEHLFPTPPVVRDSDGWKSEEWLIQKTRILIPEPNMPLEDELVPRVWISSADLGWNDISRFYADRLYDVRRATPEMKQQAGQLAAGQTSDVDKANAIFNWVSVNIAPGEGGGTLSPGRQAFTDRTGNRISVFLGLLSAARVPFRIAMTRPVTDTSTTEIASPYVFSVPLVQVAAPGAPPDSPVGWYDLNGGFAQVGYIAGALRGSTALVAGGVGDAAFTRVPQFDSPLDDTIIGVAGTVADSGAATLHLHMEFRGPNGDQVRQALQNQPTSALPQVYQQLLVEQYPSATASGGQVQNLDDRQKSVIVEIDGSVPGFIHDDGTTWDLPRLVGPSDMLSRFAPLPFREFPLLIGSPLDEQVEVKLTLPERFTMPSLPPAMQIDNDFGHFQASWTRQGDEFDFKRELFLRASVIAPPVYDQFRSFGESVDNQDRLRLAGPIAAAAPR